MIMPFGKYRGREVENIPYDYLKWLWENVELYGQLFDEVGDIIEPQEKWELPIMSVEEATGVKAVYRRMARKWHPDAGGTKEAMQAVNEFYEELQLST